MAVAIWHVILLTAKVCSRAADDEALSGSDDGGNEDEGEELEEVEEPAGIEMPSRASLAMMADAEAVAQVRDMPHNASLHAFHR